MRPPPACNRLVGPGRIRRTVAATIGLGTSCPSASQTGVPGPVPMRNTTTVDSTGGPAARRIHVKRIASIRAITGPVLTSPVFTRLVLKCLVLPCLVLPSAATWAAEDRPNILWISCEDISPHLGCYGDPHAVTPHIDALARQGVRWNNAFAPAGVCAPCRSAIITGVHQTTLGTHHMRCSASLPKDIKPFTIALRDSG